MDPMSITEKQRLALAERLGARGSKCPLDNEAIVKRYLAGERVSVIAEEFGVQKKTIYSRLRKARDGK